MTEQELKEIEARANAATPGPWEEECAYIGDDLLVDYGHWFARGPLHNGDRYADINLAKDMAALDSHFIAHARQDVPALVAEVRKVKQAARGLLDVLSQHAPASFGDAEDALRDAVEDCPAFTSEGEVK